MRTKRYAVAVIVAAFVAAACGSSSSGPDTSSSNLEGDGSGFPLSAAFSNSVVFVPDTSFVPPSQLHGDVETSTVFYNGQYVMFYRALVSGTGGANIAGSDVGYYAIARATSTDGNTFVADNGGAPVLKNDTVGLDDQGAYAPNVYVADASTLLMVYEAYTPGKPQAVAAATSSDGGMTWTKLSSPGNPLIKNNQYPWNSGGIGTPSLTRTADGTKWVVSFHGYSGTDVPGAFSRGIATAPFTNGANHGLVAPAFEMDPVPVMTALGAGSWMERGPGRADITYQAPYYYIVHEGLSGSVQCKSVTHTGWGIARSQDLLTWQDMQVISDPQTGCGDDMPAFQMINGRNLVITTTSSHQSVHRWKMVDLSAATAPEISCGEFARKDEWKAPACGAACNNVGPATYDCAHCCDTSSGTPSAPGAPPSTTCTPSCALGTTGYTMCAGQDDGCGGTCTSCAAGSSCTGLGTCAPTPPASCTPSCILKNSTYTMCAGQSDGCTGTCTTCPTGDVCSQFGTCACTPSCILAGTSYTMCSGQSNGCGGTCTTCPAGDSCTEFGTCACVPNCILSGTSYTMCSGQSDSCGGTCTTCPAGKTCTGFGTCG